MVCCVSVRLDFFNHFHLKFSNIDFNHFNHFFCRLGHAKPAKMHLELSCWLQFSILPQLRRLFQAYCSWKSNREMKSEKWNPTTWVRFQFPVCPLDFSFLLSFSHIHGSAVIDLEFFEFPRMRALRSSLQVGWFSVFSYRDDSLSIHDVGTFSFSNQKSTVQSQTFTWILQVGSAHAKKAKKAPKSICQISSWLQFQQLPKPESHFIYFCWKSNRTVTFVPLQSERHSCQKSAVVEPQKGTAVCLYKAIYITRIKQSVCAQQHCL